MQVKYLGNNVDLVSEDYYLALTTAALKVTEPSHGAYQLVFTQEPLSSKRILIEFPIPMTMAF